jgi:uncharacterized repeat protein (TIGR03803 family)
VLHTFRNGTDGAYPYTTMALSGNTLYGAANGGGIQGCYYTYGCGLIFQIDIQTGAYQVIHLFRLLDGLSPSGALTVYSGVLYGTTLLGGSSTSCVYGCGVVYKLVLDTDELTVLHGFDSSDGSFPESALTLDSAGETLYGTTPEGGSSTGDGVVFKLTLSTGAYDVLYNFTGWPDANYPYGPLTMDASGNLYGDSQLGGAGPCGNGNGCGTVFMVNPATGTDTVLYPFPRDTSNGYYPLAGITRTAGGSIYGTTAWGGLSDDGIVFELAENTETVLHSFQGSDGSHPQASVIVDSSGNVFGTTLDGGSDSGECNIYGCGVVWEITP